MFVKSPKKWAVRIAMLGVVVVFATCFSAFKSIISFDIL